MEGRAGHGAAWRGGFRNVKANQSSGIPSFTGPFQANIGIGINQQGKTIVISVEIYGYFDISDIHHQI